MHQVVLQSLPKLTREKSPGNETDLATSTSANPFHLQEHPRCDWQKAGAVTKRASCYQEWQETGKAQRRPPARLSRAGWRETSASWGLLQTANIKDSSKIKRDQGNLQRQGYREGLSCWFEKLWLCFSSSSFCPLLDFWTKYLWWNFVTVCYEYLPEMKERLQSVLKSPQVLHECDYGQ